jgi:hypothetical protein
MVFYGIALAPGSARRIDRGGDAPPRVSSSTRAAQGTCQPMIANRPVFDFKMAAVSSRAATGCELWPPFTWNPCAIHGGN